MELTSGKFDQLMIFLRRPKRALSRDRIMGQQSGHDWSPLAFVDMLDLCALGFDTIPEATGQPGYHPGVMLRIYLYGYLN